MQSSGGRWEIDLFNKLMKKREGLNSRDNTAPTVNKSQTLASGRRVVSFDNNTNNTNVTATEQTINASSIPMANNERGFKTYRENTDADYLLSDSAMIMGSNSI